MFSMIKRKKEIFQNVLLMLFMSSASFILLLKSPLHIWRHTESALDGNVFQTIALMMDHGYMPYRDSFDHKGPLLYIINYIGRHISAYRGVWVIEYIFMVVTLFSLYKIARLKCNKVISCVVVLAVGSLLLTTLCQGNRVEEYSLPFIAIAQFIFLDFLLNRRINCIRIFLCGLCLGGVCLLRPNMISVWLVFCIAVLIDLIKRKEERLIGRYILEFLVGFGSMIIPIIIWMMAKGILMDCWDCYIKFNLVYISAPEMTSFGHKCDSFFFFLNNILVICSLIISIYFAMKTEHFLYSIYVCYIISTLWLISLSGMQYISYGTVLIPVVVFPIAALLAECGKSENNLLVLIMVLLLSVSTIMPEWLPMIGSLGKMYENRHEDNISKLVRDVCYIVEKETTYAEAISVYGSWDTIYLLTGRIHATRYSYTDPLVDYMPEIKDEYFEQLKKELPRIIVIQGGFYDDDISNFLTENEYDIIWHEDKEERAAMIFEREKTEY